MRRVLWILRSVTEYVEWVECAEYRRVPRSTWIAMEYAEHVECADHAECAEYVEYTDYADRADYTNHADM